MGQMRENDVSAAFCISLALPGGPVGPLARWAARSNVEGGSGTEEGARMTIICRGPRVPSYAIDHGAGLPI